MSPVQAGIERRLFAHQATQHSADVGGGYVHEVRACSRSLQRFDQPSGAEQVGLRRKVRRVVELDRRSGVDDDVARAELVASRVGERESVTTEIDLQHGQLFFRELRESSVAQLFLEALESRARQHLALEPLRRGTPRARAYGEVDAPDLWNRTQALLDDRLAQETGAAGDQNGLAFEGLCYQDRLILESVVGHPAIQPVHGWGAVFGPASSLRHRSTQGLS